ncbi:MAG TPA: hypothetical protein VM075_09365 [Anaerolineae bacterium]|nr:hypothetical protein [Anaerolineae bacterium]
MSSNNQWILLGLLVLGLAACPACRAQESPVSQPAKDLPIHPDMELISQVPDDVTTIVASLEYWLRASCPGEWSYYAGTEDPSAVLRWYRSNLEMSGWKDAVVEEKQLPETARLPNWGVWYNQSKVVILVTHPVLVTLEGSTEEPKAGTALVLRQCDSGASR